MSWVTESWGLRAVVRAGSTTRDALREAIQVLSPTAVSRHVFTHTGWRQIADQWIYLTASGAIGGPGYEVDLGPDLARYALPLKAEDPVGAMRTSLDLLRGDIAPMKAMVPLWGAIYRAPTAAALPIDVSVWIEGTTGSLKSTLAALALAHSLAEDFAAVRGQVGADTTHRRVPEAIAHLYLGIDMGLTYATECGACSAQEARDLRGQAWETLLGISATQGALLLGERPSHRFLKVLLTLLAQRHGVLLDRDAGEHAGRAELLGWQDSSALYLLPEAAWHAVTRFCKDTGDLFPIREERLRRDLEKEGLTEADPGHRTATVRIAGRTRRECCACTARRRRRSSASRSRHRPSPVSPLPKG
jgi:hypothetical protein